MESRNGEVVIQGPAGAQEGEKRKGMRRKQHVRTEYNGLEYGNTEERYLAHI